MGQQLVQIARATRHRVVEHDVKAPGAAVFARLVLQHHAQVVHLATEAFFQAQLHRRHEGLHHPLVDAVLGVWHQNAQGLRLKLAVQIQTFQQVGGVVAVTFRAVKRMLLLSLLAIALRRLLHLAAVLAQAETRSG